jgi:hypothetical protein
MNKYLTALCISSLLSPSMGAPILAQAKSATQLAQEFYAVNDFSEAERCLRKEIDANPKNANARYLLGNVLAKENRMEEAKQQYQWVVYLVHSGALRQYSELALKELGVAVPNPLPSSSTASGAASSSPSVDVAAEQDASAIQRSAHAVSREADEKEQALNRERDKRVNQVMEEAERQTRDLEQQMREAIDANGTAVYVRAYGRRRVPYIYNPAADNEAIRKEYQVKIDGVKAEASRKCAAIKTACAVHQTAIEQSAISVDKSLLPQSQGARITLTPRGSDMYTRNYQHADDPSGDPIAVKAAQAKLLSGASNSTNDQSGKASQ